MSLNMEKIDFFDGKGSSKKFKYMRVCRRTGKVFFADSKCAKICPDAYKTYRNRWGKQKK